MHCTITALESGLRRADFRGLCYELSDQDRADCCLSDCMLCGKNCKVWHNPQSCTGMVDELMIHLMQDY